jgi:carbamoyl-phosphate synthase small subunit
VFVSNGPGDPAAVPGAAGTVRALSDAGLPVFGICLGCQLIARAFGGETFKLPYGHRGGNHPVRNLETGSVEITSQNHGFAVAEAAGFAAGAPELRVTHRNLNDGTVEGLCHTSRPVFAVQYHPEGAPGPHDSRYLFRRFVDSMGATAAVATG